MNSQKFLRKAMGILIATCLASCGSSSGGGIGGTGFVAGVIDGFGSVFVDGVEFDTTSAEITIDGVPAAESDLGVGMFVAVGGSVDPDGLSGTAESLAAEHLVVGPLDRISGDALSVDVLGDRIVIDTDTILDGISLVPGDLGTVVRISGFLDADNGIRATRIARDRSGSVEFAISGVVRELDEVAETFRIRDVTIDYSGAQIGEMPVDGLRDGLIARAVSTARPVGGVTIADRVTFRNDRFPDAKGVPVRASGVITARPDSRRFVLNDRIAVRIVGDTEIVGGTAADLRRNTLVTMAGRTDAAGTVVARIIVIRKFDAAASTPRTD